MRLEGPPIFDALVLSGGRSSRLGSVAKSELLFGQQTLLERTMDAAAGARHVVVVGPRPSDRATATGAGYLDRFSSVLFAREDPPFGGPVAGIAAGFAALAARSGPAVDALLVLACDMPNIAPAVPLLLGAFAREPHADGVIALDDRRQRQPLASVYRTSSLACVIDELRAAGPLSGMSMFGFIGGMNLAPIDVPQGSTADLDSWEDAEALGARVP